ncbi:hypothetical protein A3A67_00660 [Candidatus Peribacteria bacterium RIFCSPLOWO2_01_FULL_51_18]|nr:MAG: hypothetical protein A3A67_00660 [Candidatus Peribacteria bacterium RIFCSPLOWO2_01_FULL_51_18]
MPLKHSLETALMLLMSIVICATGVAASVLPSSPKGLVPWAVLFGISLVYPLLFQPTLKANRADYEFRLMHWFPAGIFLLWILLEFFGPRFKSVHILQLGFLFLWSWPLVALGITFLIIFSVHVIRRSAFRVTFLSLLLTAFTVGAVFTEAKSWNPRIQAFLFQDAPRQLAGTFKQTGSIVDYLRGTKAGRPIAQTGSLGVGFASSGTSVSFSSQNDKLKKSRKLTKSGPESAGFMTVTLLGFFASIVHARAKKRV